MDMGMGINEHIWVMALVNKLSAHQGSCYLFFWDLLWYKNLGSSWQVPVQMGSIWFFFFFFSGNIWVVFGWNWPIFRSLFFFCRFFLLWFPLMVSPLFFHLFSFFGVGLMRLFFLSSVDLLICLVLLFFIVYMGFLQHGCLELLINGIWIDIRKFHSVDIMQTSLLYVLYNLTVLL